MFFVAFLSMFVVFEVLYFIYMTCRLNEWYKRSKEDTKITLMHLGLAFTCACIWHTLGWL
jgi:hypothetical protein